MSARRRTVDSTTAAWLTMFILTLVTWQWGSLDVSGPLLVLPAMFIVLVKGQLLTDHFMEARRARPFWRILFGGYLLVVTIGISAAFLIG